MLVSLNTLSVLSQETVYIEANEFGRGIIKPRAAECFVIAPLHAVDGNNNIEIIGEKNAKTKGELIQATANDLAIIRTTIGAELYCEDWKVDGSYDRILENSVDGFLKIRQNDGGFKLIQVDIKEVNESNITIEPKKSNDSFSKGMSGSTLFTNEDGEKVCLGMLMEIDSENNEGYVFQIDNIIADLQDFFNLERTQETEKFVDELKQKSENSIKTSRYPIVTKNNFSAQIKSCVQKDKKVYCKFLIVNKGKDLPIVLSRYDTIFYDEIGNAYECGWVRISNTSEPVKARKKLIADIQVESEIVFNVTRNIELITKLEVKFHLNDGWFSANWRNIEIDKSE